jgi:hypothetical protein
MLFHLSALFLVYEHIILPYILHIIKHSLLPLSVTMSYNVYTLEYLGSPNHVAIFIENG